jgi:hypothetical protein
MPTVTVLISGLAQSVVVAPTKLLATLATCFSPKLSGHSCGR